MKKKLVRRSLIALATIGVIALGLRLALPNLLKQYVNNTFADMGPYTGHVEDVDVALIRGAYTLRDLTIAKRDAGREIPFLDLKSMDISVQWRALFSGELVGEIVAVQPVLNMYRAESDSQSQLGSGVNWPDQVRELFPFKFNRVEVVDGKSRFLAPGISAAEALEVSNVQMTLANLTNINESTAETMTSLDLTGVFMEEAKLTLAGNLNPNEQAPTFDINFSLEEAMLTSANPWLREFLHVDAESGNFSMYLEAAAADGAFEGYLKPVMKDLVVFESEEESEGPFRKLWEGVVQLAAEIFENRQEDQVASKVPYSGEFDDPDIGMIAAIVSLIRNAFVSALSQSIEGTVDISDVADDAATEAP